MLSLLPIHRVIALVSVCYASIIAIILALIWGSGAQLSARESVSIAVSGATVLQLSLSFAFALGWKTLWAHIPALNALLFPNLDGEWKMEIHWRGTSGGHGTVFADAVIKQDFVRISMEVAAPDSDSETLIAQPKRDPESGRPIVYYHYRVVRKNKGPHVGGEYLGAAILKFSERGGGELSGNYFTSAHTTGHFVLNRKRI